jgi:hypothetical protein
MLLHGASEVYVIQAGVDCGEVYQPRCALEDGYRQSSSDGALSARAKEASHFVRPLIIMID